MNRLGEVGLLANTAELAELYVGSISNLHVQVFICIFFFLMPPFWKERRVLTSVRIVIYVLEPVYGERRRR